MLPSPGWLGAAPDTSFCPAMVSLAKGSQEAPGMVQAEPGRHSGCVPPDQSPASPGREVAALTTLLSFSLLRSASVYQRQSQGETEAGLTPPGSFPTPPSTCCILSQLCETPTQDWETSWCGGKPEKTRICGGDMSCCSGAAWVSP